MLPCKALFIAVSLGNYRNEDQTFQLSAQRFIHLIVLQQSIGWILVEVNGYIFLECGFNFCTKRAHKFRYPAFALVITLAIANEDVVFVAREDRSHREEEMLGST